MTSAVTPPWLVSPIIVAPAMPWSRDQPEHRAHGREHARISRSSAPDTSMPAASRNAEKTTMSVVAML
jgi:hypothetical protein